MSTANHCPFCLYLDQDGELMMRFYVSDLIPMQWSLTRQRLWISSTGGIGAQILLVRFRLSKVRFRLSLVCFQDLMAGKMLHMNRLQSENLHLPLK